MKPAADRPLPSAAWWTLALSSTGVLLVALGYASARADAGTGIGTGTGFGTGTGTGAPALATAAYWCGQLLVFLPVAARVCAGRTRSRTEAFLLVTGLAVNQYLQKVLFSPDQFRFPDELQHQVATTTLLHTGRLFQVNLALPIAERFPGLAEMAGAVTALTGLPVVVVGLLVAGVCRLIFVGALFLLVTATGRSPRVAAGTCVCYATALHYLFFDAMFLYQTAALPFLLLVLRAALRWWRPAGSAALPGVPASLGALAAMVVVVASHHVTALIMVGALLLGGAAAFPASTRRPLVFVPAASAAVVVIAWFTLAARSIVGYFGYPARSLRTSLTALWHGGGADVAMPANPRWELVVQFAGLLALAVLSTVAAVRWWRGRYRGAWWWLVLTGALLFFAGSAVRVLGAQGPELAGRATTFTYIPLSMLVSAVLLDRRRRHRDDGPARRPSLPPSALRPSALRPSGRMCAVVPVAAATAVLTLLMLGARAGGWPPYWGRLPGPHLVSAYERSVDPPGVLAARWMGVRLPEGARTAADSVGYTLVSTYGRQDPVGDVAPLFSPDLSGDPALRHLYRLSVEFVWVDLRTASALPRSGSYFPQDPQADRHRRPLDRSALDRFDSLPGTSRLYDNGIIRVYDVRRA